MSIAVHGTVQRLGERLLVTLPEEASSALPSRGQVAVDAELNGHGFVTVLEPDGRKGHWISVDEPLRDALSLTQGDSVVGTITPTKAWPEPELPEDLSGALADAPDLADAWADITPMARWEWVRWVGATRNPQTRERRVEVTVSKLRDGKRRPCCFDLASCTDPELSRSGKLLDIR
ncbi:YdeI/OmpD-associated family protein [Ornithinimicrobium cavernae]|uniref:YdeI/OmpD-associated family protein n=1 Tax=Ornithinimicrobium cavernae TaxID=2666047 RepID=UPI000D6914FA|nr:YdeI/OmpD-associated family protein [Ornithinimicrobium cavernae]